MFKTCPAKPCSDSSNLGVPPELSLVLMLLQLTLPLSMSDSNFKTTLSRSHLPSQLDFSQARSHTALVPHQVFLHRTLI